MAHKVQDLGMADRDLLAQLRNALENHHRALEELESAIIEFEEAAEGRALNRPEARDFELLSIPQICQFLDMGKSWVYRRIHNGEIPSVRLGRAIKVRRSDLEQYLEEHRTRPADSTQP
jgi:excisionase family DNA binding protein